MFWWSSDPQEVETQENASPAPPRPTIGIAFGAGAARGWAHIGVIERLVEEGLPLDVVAGTSIGALAGGCFSAGKLDALKTFALELTRRRVFSLMDFSWRGGGLIAGNRLRDLLEEQLGEQRFDQLERPFICIATELMSGHEVWLKDGEVANAIRASYALPGVFKPVERDGRWLIDGAVVNPIPVSACRAMQARLVIAVNVNNDAFGGTVIQNTDPLSALTRSDSPDDGLKQLVGRGAAPGMTTVLVAAFNISQDRLARSRLGGDPPDITIVPRTPDIGLFDFDRAKEAIAAGRDAAARALPEIEDALARLNRAAML